MSKEIEAKTGFHSIDGLYFQRVEKGKVLITQFEDEGASDRVLFQVVVPDGVWASIVCSVSNKGENGERWEHILDFHNSIIK